MPLVLVTGFPSSGKSQTAKEIERVLKEKLLEDEDPRQVRIVSDNDNLDWDGRNEIYMSIAKEKELRGWLKAETQRYINLNQIVILDAAAYIKGFRYELFCVAKEATTQYCVVELFESSPSFQELCWKWNEQSLARSSEESRDPDSPEPGYTRGTFDALVMRYEKCDETNRWDSPLFRIHPANEQLNFDELYRVLTKEGPLVPNRCTILTSTTKTIYKPTNQS